MASEFDIQGLDPVLKKLRTLVPKLQKKALRSAGTKAMKIVRDAARAGARRLDDPASAENIAKNIVTQYSSKASKRLGGSVTRVGVLGGAKSYSNTTRNRGKGRVGKSYSTGGSSSNPGGDTFYWRFLEFGTSRIRARPFMRPALAERVDKVTNIYVSSLDADITKIIAKGL